VYGMDVGQVEMLVEDCGSKDLGAVVEVGVSC